MTLVSNWRDVAEQKREATNSKIPREWVLSPSTLAEAGRHRDITLFIGGLLSAEERDITALESNEIVEKIAAKRYTAEQVTTAFCKRAAIAHQLNHCLHEIFFVEAITRARELDEEFERTGSTTGLLHGLPISLKDQFHVKGVETTVGYVGWIGTFEGKKGTGKEFRVESHLATELRSLGAVLYCKTAVPQTLLLDETMNNIVGSVMNPVNQKLSPGGSSGGEAALQVLRGSTLGVGTDIGGSVRCPPAFCGTYGIKPSFGRFSYMNLAPVVARQTVMPPTIGFMATALLSLRFIMSAVLSTNP